MTPRAALLFAAGFGTRMRPLTETRPKPLIPVAGRALLDHALELAAGAGVPRLVVNAHYRVGQIVDHLHGRDIAVSVEAPDILDTGGGLVQARPLLGPGPVFTLNTDAVWTGPNPLRALAAEWDAARMGALLLCVPLSRARGRAAPGDFTLAPAGQLRRGGDLVYTGAQIVAETALEGIEARVFSLNHVWDRLARQGRLFGLVHAGRWCDVGRPENIPEAEEMLRDV